MGRNQGMESLSEATYAVEQATLPVSGISAVLGKSHWCKHLKRLFIVGDSLLQVLSPLPSNAVAVGVCQVVLRGSPPFGESLSRKHRECLLTAVNGLFQVVSSLPSDAITVGNRQTELCRSPLFGESLLRVDCERLLV